MMLRIAFATDFHATPSKNAGDSWVQAQLPDDPTVNPLFGIQNLAIEKSLKADILMIGGDITNRADASAVQYAWKGISNLAELLGDAKVIATPGNHDVDSRFSVDNDAHGALIDLSPTFPIWDEALSYKFWARRFVCFSPSAGLRVLVLNSSAYHGYAPDPEHPEYLRGFITLRTIERIKRELSESQDQYAVNILLCHHHPHRHQDIEDSDYSSIVNGERLIDMLGQGQFGRWVIVHGHKHHGRICYAAGNASAPIVFAGSSFGAKPRTGLPNELSNQFYLLTFYLNSQEQYGLQIACEFNSWSWSYGNGWVMASGNNGLPARGGFGYRPELTTLAREILKHIESQERPFFNWEDLCKFEKKLPFLTPGDYLELFRQLKTIGLIVSYDENGHPAQVSRHRP